MPTNYRSRQARHAEERRGLTIVTDRKERPDLEAIARLIAELTREELEHAKPDK